MNTKHDIAIWGKEGDDYPIYDKIKFSLVLRSIRKVLPRHLTSGTMCLLDVGCGYDARILQHLQSEFVTGIGLDLEVSDALKKNPKLIFHEGDLTEVLPALAAKGPAVDFIVFLSILEHLEDPISALTAARALLRPKGRIFFNSPTWFGKWVLENVISNKLLDPYGETPKQYNSHKMYYNPRDMWPLLVKAGFVSTEIHIWRSNFGCSISGYAEKS